VGDVDANTNLRVLKAREHLLLLERIPLRLNRLRTWPNLLGVVLSQRVSLLPIANDSIISIIIFNNFIIKGHIINFSESFGGCSILVFKLVTLATNLILITSLFGILILSFFIYVLPKQGLGLHVN